MSGKRIAAIVLIVLLVLCFSGMIAALASGRNDLFFILGGVLVGVIIIGYVLKKTVKKDEPAEEQKKD